MAVVRRDVTSLLGVTPAPDLHDVVATRIAELLGQIVGVAVTRW